MHVPQRAGAYPTLRLEVTLSVSTYRDSWHNDCSPRLAKVSCSLFTSLMRSASMLTTSYDSSSLWKTATRVVAVSSRSCSAAACRAFSCGARLTVLGGATGSNLLFRAGERNAAAVRRTAVGIRWSLPSEQYARRGN